MSTSTFSEVVKEQFPILVQYAPVLARVHGRNHPELAQVRDIVAEINDKIKEDGAEQVELSTEFEELRRLTNNYEIPSDGCGTYVETYEGLEAADKAYHS
jgi:regulator of cell morphogenesis and NO signaling